MLKICFSLFVTGILLGLGPCLVSCGPILLSYIAGTKKSPLEGLRSWFIFSVSRISIYIFLGGIAGFAGSELFRRFYWEPPGYIIWLASGTFISLLGLLIFLGKTSNSKLCQALNESLIQNDTKSLITLGILIGIFPCIPLIGIFSYITMVSTHYSQGIIMSASFGLGTLISPLIFLSLLTTSIPKLRLLREEKNLSIFQRICGIILFALGVHILVKTIVEWVQTA